MTDKVRGLKDWVSEVQMGPEEICTGTRTIYDAMLGESTGFDAPDFSRIDTRDLSLLFKHYDRMFFDSRLGGAVGQDSLLFRISSRMTRAGGKTIRRRFRLSLSRPERFEIVVSSHLLFQTFHDVKRPVVVAGIICHDRLQALQRIFEHELLHLYELLIWTDSNCATPRFRNIAKRIFGHLESTHDLVTSYERAAVKYKIRVGDKVGFRVDGKRYAGFVNRISKRATVLVEARRGVLYSDGRKYLKFYVPVPQLERLN